MSANSIPAITAMAENYEQYLTSNPKHRDAIAYTLSSRRERLKLGSYCVVDGLAVSELAAPIPDQGVRRVAFVFTGQGAQWVGMGKELMREQPVFAESIRSMDEVLRSLKHSPQWTLEGEIAGLLATARD